jgi:hypothetical protein
VVQFHPIPLTKKQIIMERQELIDFLRENLSIEVETSREWDYSSEYITVTTSIRLRNENGEYETLTSDYDSFSVNN